MARETITGAHDGERGDGIRGRSRPIPQYRFFAPGSPAADSRPGPPLALAPASTLLDSRGWRRIGEQAKARRRGYWRALRRSKDEIMNVRAEAVQRRGRLERAIARVARVLAHPAFVLAELVLHLGWVLLNSGVVSGVRPWDPYPFAFMTGFASVQALFIGLLILMYAEQDSHVGELRQELDLQVALHSERETSKVLRMLAELQTSLGVQSEEHDHELELMAQPLDPARLKQVTEEHLREAKEGEN